MASPTGSSAAEAPKSSGGITLRVPSQYASSPSAATTMSPPSSFLNRTWSVTHSTLSMWRTARNVRITYTELPALAKSGAALRVDDLVEYEALSGKGGVKTVAGIDTASPPVQGEDAQTQTFRWDWRGKGWLFFVTSHWEILGWGKRPLPNGKDGEVERWVVTWFASTLFTSEGIDIYCDRKEGLSKETEALLLEALKSIGVKQLVNMVDKDMRPVAISLPWKTK